MGEQLEFKKRVEDESWRFADYHLSWDPESRILRYQAEGQDNPKDLWGFDTSYVSDVGRTEQPGPNLKVMDAYILADIARVFGPDVEQKVRRWLEIP